MSVRNRLLMIITLILALTLLTSCHCSCGQLALDKTEKTLKDFEPELKAYWDSELFRPQMTPEERAEAKQNRLELLQATYDTIKVARTHGEPATADAATNRKENGE